MTEEEAKLRWCPFYRAPKSWADDGRREAREIGEQSCIASECMAWRYDPSSYDSDGVPLPGTTGTEGYCGLAGTTP